MRTYDAIEKVSSAIIKDNICEAVFLKGSIARGDDDEYSDVDMYVIVSEEKMEEFLSKRLDYLTSYKPVIYYSYVNFVGPQIVVIFDDGLHFDLYAVTKGKISTLDKAKIIYDPHGLMNNYVPEIMYLKKDDYVEMFNDVLYSFIEADAAYKRKNYPWASRILDQSIAWCAILLRYIYEPEHAYLGLKKINEVLPAELYRLIEAASKNLNEDGYGIANKNIITILEHIEENIDKDIRSGFNLNFLEWIKKNLNVILF